MARNHLTRPKVRQSMQAMWLFDDYDLVKHLVGLADLQGNAPISTSSINYKRANSSTIDDLAAESGADRGGWRDSLAGNGGLFLLDLARTARSPPHHPLASRLV